MKKEYFIWISGRDFYYLTRFLDDSEYELVKSIIDELNTQYEGCGIELLLSPEEIKKFSLKIYPEKPSYPDFNKCLQIISAEYPKQGIFWQEFISSLICDYTKERDK
jgi:hypothetical protein